MVKLQLYQCIDVSQVPTGSFSISINKKSMQVYIKNKYFLEFICLYSMKSF